MRVMVCDSENNDICRLRDLISEYGADHNMSFDIEYYGNGEALMAALEDEGCPDIIIVEISSETGGIDAVKQIRSASGSVPLIIISSEIRYALAKLGSKIAFNETDIKTNFLRNIFTRNILIKFF